MKLEKFEGSYWDEDLTCWVTCACGYELDEMVSDYKIERCPECGRGYKAQFKMLQYEPEEVNDGTKRS
jgi:hypothetical protein